jgi:hypothetical protein
MKGRPRCEPASRDRDKRAPTSVVLSFQPNRFAPPASSSAGPARSSSCSRVGLINGPFLQANLRPLPPPEKIATLVLRSRLTCRLG